ncbi:GTP cyclohydrolase 1, partial [Haemophilus influenzae]
SNCLVFCTTSTGSRTLN